MRGMSLDMVTPNFNMNEAEFTKECIRKKRNETSEDWAQYDVFLLHYTPTYAARAGVR
jgi:hypothetical protein